MRTALPSPPVVPTRLRTALVVLLAVAVMSPAAARDPYRMGPKGPARPARIVSLAPSLTETVIALGASRRLVGVSRYCDFPEVEGLTRIGGYSDPNLEAILALEPDLLVAEPSPGNEAVVRRLAELGVPVRVVFSGSLDEIAAAVRAVADDLGVPEVGEAVARRFEERIELVRDVASGRPRPRALLVYGHEPIVVAGPGSYADELLRAAGGLNLVEAAPVPYPIYPLEKVVALDPEVIIDLVVHAGGTPRPAPFEALGSLRAVREGRVVRLDSQRLLRPGPGLADGLVELFMALHPDAPRPGAVRPSETGPSPDRTGSP